MPAVLLIAALIAQTPQTPAPATSQGPATLRWIPKEGDELHYRTVAELTVGGNSATLTSTNTHKVIRVDPDGSYTIQATVTESKVMVLGEEKQGTPYTTVTSYGPDGEIQRIEGDKPEATGYRMANLTDFHAPTKAVAVGDAWTANGKADPKTGAVAWRVDYKVVSEETVNNYDALKMDVIAREMEGADAGKATGNVWVTRDGLVAKSDFTWSSISVPGAPGPVSGKITLTRMP